MRFFFACSTALAMADGTSAEKAVADYSQAVGAKPETIVAFSEELMNTKVKFGVDFIVRKHGLTAEQVHEHIEGSTPAFHKQLLLSLYHGNYKMADELALLIKQGRKI